MYERLIQIMASAGRPKVLLVGDFMVDNYLLGDVDRISPEAPVMVMKVRERQEQPGGAGSVAMDLATLDAETVCLGVVGDDDTGRRLQKMLCDTGKINAGRLVSMAGRPTTFKQRIVGLAQQRHQQQLMRIDEEESGPVSLEVQEQLLTEYKAMLDWCDVVCLEDYNKGVMANDFSREMIELAGAHGKKVIIDPASINDYSRYTGAWLVKPNRREMGRATGIEMKTEGDWLEACRILSHECEIENLVVTLDKLGAFLYQRETDKGEIISTRPRSVYDVTGAGDMVLAMLGLVIGGQYGELGPPTLQEVVALANVAGGLEVERFGCVGISREEIMAELSRERQMKSGKLRSLDALLKDVSWHKQQKQTIVFTNGCFDILHPGHINLLTFAKEQGEVLILAINSDNSVRRLKGESRPILKEQDRAALVSALEAVDYVVIFDEDTPQHLIEKITPDVLIKGSDWAGNVVGQEWVEQHGGKVVLMPLMKGRSTTNIINEVIERYADSKLI